MSTHQADVGEEGCRQRSGNPGTRAFLLLGAGAVSGLPGLSDARGSGGASHGAAPMLAVACRSVVLWSVQQQVRR